MGQKKPIPVPAELANLKIKKSPKSAKVRSTPLWTPDDGITFSLLTKFIICRHRFWIRTVCGLREDIGFNHRIEYGSLLHAGFEEYSRTPPTMTLEGRLKHALKGIRNYADSLKQKFMGEEENIDWWYSLAKAQFRIYADNWLVKDAKRHYIFQERVFDVKTKLPSGRIIRLRGKYDEYFEQRLKSKSYHVLQENKSKGEIDQEGILSALNCDLQTMMYLHCLAEEGYKCDNILYNVVLRPLGGKYPMRQKVSETKDEFRQRAIDDMENNREKYFHRSTVTLEKGDLDRFRHQSFYPYLESVLDWWESIQNEPFDPWNSYYKSRQTNEVYKLHNKHHFARPLGVFDALALGNRGDYFQHVITDGKDLSGLVSLDTVFPELDDPSLSADKTKKGT